MLKSFLMIHSNLLRKAALGCLFKGYLHNLRGPLQALLMQIEILESKLTLVEDPAGLSEGVGRLKKQVFQLVELLAAAEEDLGREDQGPWNLREIVEKELLFWQAELDFKHKVEKEIDLPENLRVKMPYNRLRAGFCALFFGMVSGLAEKKGRLRISAREEPGAVVLRFEVGPAFLEPENPFLQAAREVWSPEARLRVTPETLEVSFST